MNELLQSAQHPDADQLTAFAEHALPAHEREQTLAHLATCATCRQVVFLAQEEEPVAQPVVVRKPWFAGWNLVWPAALALGGIVAFSVHLRHVTTGGREPEKVAIVTETPPIPAAPVLAPEVVARAHKPLQRSDAEAVVPVAPPLVTAMSGSLQQEGVAVQAQDQASVGVARARDKAVVPLHGPMGTQQQIVTPTAPRVTVQHYSQAPASLAQAPPAPPKPSVAIAGMGAGRMAAAAPPPPVAVTLGSAAAAAAPAPPAAKAAPQVAAMGASSQTADVSAMGDVVTESRNAITVTSANVTELPSGLATAAKVSNGSRTVALDSAGAVFVSKDNGKRWAAVKAQWAGRVVQVNLIDDTAAKMKKSAQPAEVSAASTEADIAKAKPKPFSLTTDAGVVWTSNDGQKWKRQ